MKKFWINTIICIVFICLFLFKDRIYLIFDNEIFTHDKVTEEYCTQNSAVFPDITSNVFHLEHTSVLYQDIYNFKKEITIYKGLDYNLKENMALIDSNGLLGIINNVDKTTSRVMLLTNGKLSLSIKVADSYGLLKYVDNNLIITNLTSENINIEDKIYTSGLANQYGKILIGEVLKEYNDTSQKSYIVKNYSDLNNINNLAIIKEVK